MSPLAKSSETTAGFHDGELAVQKRAGVTNQAARLAGMLAPGELSGGMARFLGDRTFAAITARGADGILWTSPLTGAPGFLAAATPTTLTIVGSPAPGDPLHGLSAGQPVGILVIDFATRRRVRINGTLSQATASDLFIDVEQAYGNCPQYIQHRTVTTTDRQAAGSSAQYSSVTDEDRALIRASDTFLLGTTHPTRGTDTSHRGGPAGFVRVDDGGDLWWPDYPGNNMFNSLGNIAIDPATALLFIDFASGHTLHLAGRAATEWSSHPGTPGDDGSTGRRTAVTVEHVVNRESSLHSTAVVPYPHNPPTTNGTRR